MNLCHQLVERLGLVAANAICAPKKQKKHCAEPRRANDASADKQTATKQQCSVGVRADWRRLTSGRKKSAEKPRKRVRAHASRHARATYATHKSAGWWRRAHHATVQRCRKIPKTNAAKESAAHNSIPKTVHASRRCREKANAIASQQQITKKRKPTHVAVSEQDFEDKGRRSHSMFKMIW